MKQWVSNLSGLSDLRQETDLVPEPGENEVLVKIHAVSLNYRDVEGTPPQGLLVGLKTQPLITDDIMTSMRRRL